MEFIKKLKDRTPEYDTALEELITRFTVMQGGKAGSAGGDTAYLQGKYFTTKYEIYMYAILIGLRNEYRVPISPSANTVKFIEIRHWQPNDLADYVVMCVIAKSSVNFNKLEEMDDKELEKEILNLKRLMEEYANGGFDKIRAKLETEPSFFDNNDNCFIDLLE